MIAQFLARLFLIARFSADGSMFNNIRRRKTSTGERESYPETESDGVRTGGFGNGRDLGTLDK